MSDEAPSPHKLWLRIGLVSALVLHVFLSLGYQTSLPLFNWPDEPAHFNYVRRLAEGRFLDVMDETVWAPQELERLKRTHFAELQRDLTSPVLARIRYEAHQPPVYYALAAVGYGLIPSPRATKILNMVLSCLVLVMTYWIGETVLKVDPWSRLAAVLFLAVVPMRCFMAVSISNDLAAELAFATFLLAVLRGWHGARLGFLIGLGLLVKVNLILALPLYACWLAYPRSTSNVVSRGRWREILAVSATALIVASPWLARNTWLYGWHDPLALKAGALGYDEAAAAAGLDPRPKLGLTGEFGLMSFLRILFESSWGVFGWMEMFVGREIFVGFVILSVVAASGLATGLWRIGKVTEPLYEQRQSIRWLGSAVLLFFVALVLYSMRDFQAQGRYLYLASPAIGVLYAAGARWALGRWAVTWGIVSTLGLVAVNLYVIRYVIPWYLTGGGG